MVVSPGGYFGRLNETLPGKLPFTRIRFTAGQMFLDKCRGGGNYTFIFRGN